MYATIHSFLSACMRADRHTHTHTPHEQISIYIKNGYQQIADIKPLSLMSLSHHNTQCSKAWKITM